jgi:[ribosomal protein S5]-alanine N-acetyltransferase
MVVTLRPLALDDIDAVHSWAQLPESCRYQPWGPNTYEQTAEYVRRVVATRDQRVHAVVVDGEVAGTADLTLHGPTTGEIGYLVHPRLWGRGIATAAARELLRIGFTEHGRHRIFGTCDPRNVASAAVLRKVGMRYEGRMRGTALLRDGWRDSDLYAILVDD